MDSQLIATIVSGLLIAVGLAGVVVPVLPGSVSIAIALLVWALALQNTVGWVVFAVGMVFVAAGMLASAVLTGRKLKERQVPNHSILVGVVVGIAGMFVIPVVGLFVGFAVGLLLSEFVRRRDFRDAAGASVAALKAMGLGVLAELGCAFAAGTVWSIGVVTYYFVL
ncbi:DUF456 domain-containing protein [Arthrobacter sp. I2-34]|uniref:DUF456 domain-containing protein n=1 Tax=Arthrobacter hankyongi TaxID=2904801 RepID=A0ABS9L5N8_9MICC|nr:DUF456 domain-containing protein [Arthrobacter hankyongi]MCG2621968.1 DUF456 domain-containing protein [Arthrobacter hankyongi]